MQNFHNTFRAEIGLQKELNLPTNHTAPFYTNMGLVTPAVLREISIEVKDRLSVNEGAEVFDYLGRWEPWQPFLMAQPEVSERVEILTGIYHKRVEVVERKWENRAIVLMAYARYEDSLNLLSKQRTEGLSQIFAQKAAQLLVNFIAAARIDRKSMPECFR